MADIEFRISGVPPGSALSVGDAAVFNAGGTLCAAQGKCTHMQGPLSEGKLDGSTVTCPGMERNSMYAPERCYAARQKIRSRPTV